MKNKSYNCLVFSRKSELRKYSDFLFTNESAKVRKNVEGKNKFSYVGGEKIPIFSVDLRLFLG